MPASTMTMPEARRAAQLYESGLSQPEVAKRLQRSRKAVRTALRRLGVELRRHTPSGRGHYSRTQFQPGHPKNATSFQPGHKPWNKRAR